MTYREVISLFADNLFFGTEVENVGGWSCLNKKRERDKQMVEQMLRDYGDCEVVSIRSGIADPDDPHALSAITIVLSEKSVKQAENMTGDLE